MHVFVNAATSLDGKTALAGGKPLRLSDAEDLRRVHRLRHDADAILVGVGTVLADDPSLLVKAEHLGRAPERHPLRVVLDSRARAPTSARVFDGRAPTLVVTAEGHAKAFPNADTVAAGAERVDLRRALAVLESRGVRSLMVEGGGTVIASFLRESLADDVYVYHAPAVVGGGAPTLADGLGAAAEDAVTRVALVDARRQGEGVLTHWRPRRP